MPCMACWSRVNGIVQGCKVLSMLYPLFSHERVLRFGLHLSLGIKKPLHQGIQRHYNYSMSMGYIRNCFYISRSLSGSKSR